MKRRLVIGGLSALGAVGAAWKFHLFGKHYPPTPYDDLLGQIVDRDAAAKLGAAVLAGQPGLTAPAIAAQLRKSSRALSGEAVRDADGGRLREVDGWMLPESLTLYAALAAKV